MNIHLGYEVGTEIVILGAHFHHPQVDDEDREELAKIALETLMVRGTLPLREWEDIYRLYGEPEFADFLMQWRMRRERLCKST